MSGQVVVALLMSCDASCAANGGYADVVAACEFVKRSARATMRGKILLGVINLARSARPI
jgi:hypothetical protein